MNVQIRILGAVVFLMLSSCGSGLVRDNDVADPQASTQALFTVNTRGFAATPFTHVDFSNAPEDLQFAVVSDRTGGHRAGVFRSAVRKLNLLQPEFVLSVGDLIEGYSTDRRVIEAQWLEFANIIDELEVPFFHTPGNHDFSNQVMADIWQERHGPSYYHFLYKNALFLVLNTEEVRDLPTADLDTEQLSYFSEVLDSNQDVRWTFVLLHQPLWAGDGAHNWQALEAKLDDRDYTAFAGHQHTYQYHAGDSGAEHITLATTGGTTPGRGRVHGEFDHITWVTIRDPGPVIANLSLSGIDDRYITSPDFAVAFSSNPVFRPQPWFVTEQPGIGATHDIVFTIENQFDWALDYRIEMPASIRYQLLSETPSGTLQPDESQLISIQLRLATELKEPLVITASARVMLDELDVAEWDRQFLMQPVRRYAAARSLLPITFDGKVDEWADMRFDVTGGRGGNVDRFQFDASYDDEFLYIALEVTDDELVLATSNDIGLFSDFVQLLLDARPTLVSAANLGFGNGVKPGDFAVMFAAPDGGKGRTPARDLMPEGSGIKLSHKAGGYTAEFAIPVPYLNDTFGGDWHEFRLNVAINDADPSSGQPAEIISWQPAWAENIYGTGIFQKR